MRIAQVVTYVSADGAFGGPVAVALAQSVELARRGHEVHLYAAWDGVARVDAPGVRLHLARVRRPRLGLPAIVSLPLLVRLLRRRSAFDAVHVHYGRDLVSVTAALVAGRGRTVLQTHGMVMPDGRPKARLLDGLAVRRALRGAAAVLALTDAEVDGLARVAGPEARVVRIDNGIAVPDAVDESRPAPPVVLFLARLHPRKRVTVFAEAAARILRARDDVRFRVVGADEGDLPALQALIDGAGLRDRLDYAGAVGPGEGEGELRRAAVFVLPSVGEVYPMTVLESLAVGTPVVLSVDCGLSPRLGGADAALIVEPTEEGVRAAVERLLDDPAERAALSRRGLDLARREFAIGAVADRLLGLYAGTAP